jgi:hypothetical protein
MKTSEIMKLLLIFALIFPSLTIAGSDKARFDVNYKKASEIRHKARNYHSRVWTLKEEIRALKAEIEGLEAEDLILHKEIKNISLTPGCKENREQMELMV